jgi:hypothetical protein
MDDALFVRGGQRLRDLQRKVERLAQWQGPIRQTLAQRLALEQLHHGVDGGPLAAEVVDGEDVRVRQCRHRLGLTLEAGERRGIVSAGGRILIATSRSSLAS